MKLKRLLSCTALILTSCLANAGEADSSIEDKYGVSCFWIFCDILSQSPEAKGIGFGDPPRNGFVPVGTDFDPVLLGPGLGDPPGVDPVPLGPGTGDPPDLEPVPLGPGTGDPPGTHPN